MVKFVQIFVLMQVTHTYSRKIIQVDITTAHVPFLMIHMIHLSQLNN